MKTIQEATAQLLRGPRVSRFLESLGIDSRRFWLLIDLFGLLSERGEMLDELGRSGVALQFMAWLYAAFFGLISVLLVVSQPALATYSLTFLVLTAFLLLTVLLSETANSLVNPVEGLVLAHQPINGATYTAAKLTHLVRIILYLAPGINAVPAFAGLLLKEAGWSYPLIHLLAALGVGLVAALLCCALYGWLMRFVPPRRLKAAGQLAATMPLLAMIWWQPARELIANARVLRWLPAQAEARWALSLTFGAAAVAIVAFGVRSLSADYLIRVSSMMHGSSATGAEPGRSRIGEIVARFFGGQPSRAGFAFVSRMARRDFQFRRRVVPLLLIGLVGLVPLAARDWRTDPFSGQFTTMHLVPHILGGLLFIFCNLLAYGSDFKGAWLFLLAPTRAFGPFSRGVYAALVIPMIVIPHGIMLPFLAWAWGMWSAGLFIAYSVAASLVYLALDLQRIDGAPFSKQVDPARGATLLPLMMATSMAMAGAVALQYFLVFRSPGVVVIVTVVLASAAYFLTRGSLDALETSIRHNLALLSAESGTLYREIDV
jgi:hypothetical protein